MAGRNLYFPVVSLFHFVTEGDLYYTLIKRMAGCQAAYFEMKKAWFIDKSSARTSKLPVDTSCIHPGSAQRGTRDSDIRLPALQHYRPPPAKSLLTF